MLWVAQVQSYLLRWSEDFKSYDPSLEITFRHINTSTALEARIRSLAARLDRFSSHITRYPVILEAPHACERFLTASSQYDSLLPG